MNSTAVAQIRVPFHGAELMVFGHEGQPYTPMKQIVEGMGLDWRSQASKFRSNRARWGVAIITTPTNGSEQNAICLPLRKLPGWLMTLQPSRVAPEIREKVITYQNECDDALWRYWNDGEAINPRSRPEKTRMALPGGLHIEQQDAIKQLVKARVEALPKEKQARAAITCWSALKSKFAVGTYKEIAPEHYGDALSLIARIVLEGELLPKEEAAPADGLEAEIDRRVQSAFRLGRWLMHFDDKGNAVMNPVPLEAFVISEDKFETVLGEPGCVALRYLPGIINACVKRLRPFVDRT